MPLPLERFAYDLPPELIAQTPADRRDQARLLDVGEQLGDRKFSDIDALLPEGAVLVVNDTRVVPARLAARKPTGGAVELLLLERLAADDGARDAQRWRCLARASKKLTAGTVLTLERTDGTAVVEAAPRVTLATDRAGDGTVEVLLPEPTESLLDEWGDLPLPPYIERPAGNTAEDRERYQTVFAREPGAVAAPTAGLHFTEDVLARVRARGIDIAAVTLHVGLGTFAPVRVDDFDDHDLHYERFTISPETAALVESDRPVVAVGTTVVRALEAAMGDDGRLRTGWQQTNLFIKPGFRFRAVDWLVTNFHLPESTLLVLVAAFAGYDTIMAAYRHAVARRYRFFSYGDAMLLRCAPDVARS